LQEFPARVGAGLPRITVAVPTCDGGRFVGEAVRSIVGQKGVEFELLVVDDRSEDGTLEVVREVAGDRARVVVNSERLGLAGNWNRCVELAGTEWVAVFHQDDVMLEGHLAAHARAIAGRADLGMVCSGGDVIDESGAEVAPSVVEWPVIGDKDEVYESGGFVRELSTSNPVRCSAVTMNREAHRALGGFNPAWKYAVDWEFWVRMGRRYPVAWLCHRTVAVRWHGASETHRFKVGTLDLDEQARVVEAVLATDGAGWADVAAARRRADRRLARGYLGRAHQAAKAGDGKLCRRAMKEAWRRWPGVFRELVRDPRLLGRLAVGAWE
jgi:glycosyltransferase involved in cell wall biosynthesis